MVVYSHFSRPRSHCDCSLAFVFKLCHSVTFLSLVPNFFFTAASTSSIHNSSSFIGPQLIQLCGVDSLPPFQIHDDARPTNSYHFV